MITRSDIEKLGTVHAVEPTVLSLYLTVPLDPAQLPGLPGRARELLAHVHPAGQPRETDRDKVLAEVAELDHDWLGHGVAVFCSADIGLFELYRLPGAQPERAVLGTRPHIRPLLAAVQRHPAYRVAVVDRRSAWVFAINGDEIAAVTDSTAVAVPSYGQGLDSYRVHERVVQFARQHYHATAVILAEIMRHGEQEPLVIGGHLDGITQLLASLPPHTQEMYAGSFVASTRTLTPARVLELSAPVAVRWAEQRAQRLAADITRLPSGAAVSGLEPCLAAVNADAADVLVVPDDGLVAGYACARCGALGTTADICPDWGTAAQAVPDLIEEMVARTLRQGGQVCIVPDVPGHIAVRLHIPGD